MIRLLLFLTILTILTTTPAAAQHIISQVTFEPGCGCEPSVAVSRDHYTAVAFSTECGGDLQVGVQLLPTDPHTDEIWPDPVIFGPGTLPTVCYSRDGFTVAFALGSTVHVYQSDLDGVWDLDEPTVFEPGAPVIGLDLWAAQTDAAGDAVFLIMDSGDDTYRTHLATRSSYSGWTDLSLKVGPQSLRPGSQVTWIPGPAGPRPCIYYLASGGTGLYRIFQTDEGWTDPQLIPGDGGSGPVPFESEFDVAHSTSHAIVGLGPQPTCPCGTIHFMANYGSYWEPEENVTVWHDEFDWPMSPRIDGGWDGTQHVFWYQRVTGEMFEPRGGVLEYWVDDWGEWTDHGAFLDHLTTGLGDRVDVAVNMLDNRAVLVWSKIDTIAGEPQLEQVFVARPALISDAPDGVVPGELLPDEAVPTLQVALEAWPNPFNPRVNLAVTVPSDGTVRLDVYDARGRLLQRVHDGALPAGRHEFAWNGEGSGGFRAPSGVYFAQVTSDAGRSVRKLVLTE